jgi:hypothetical protein
MTQNPAETGSTSVEWLRAVLVVIATAGTIAFNALSATGFINGVTPEQISDKYLTIVTPAGYAFSIWSLVYVGLIAFSIYNVLPGQIARLRPIRSLHIVSCVLNCAWIYCWHSDLIGLCFAIIAALWLTLILIIARLGAFRSLADTWILHGAFGIYCGWVTAATLVNFAVLLVYLGKMPDGTAGMVLGSVLLLTAAAIAVFVRAKFGNFFFPLSIAWAATAIAVKNSSVTPIVVAAAFATVICLVTSGSIVTTLKDSSSE